MSDLRERFGAYFGDINSAMTAFQNNEEWREAVLVEIENLVHAARAEEIEACAKVVEEKLYLLSIGDPGEGPFTKQDRTMKEVVGQAAAAIRARAPRARVTIAAAIRALGDSK